MNNSNKTQKSASIEDKRKKTHTQIVQEQN